MKTSTATTDTTSTKTNIRPPSIDQLKRDTINFTKNELMIVARVFRVLQEAPAAVQSWFRNLGRDFTRRLSVVTGVGSDSCGIAIKFADTGIIECKEINRRGRPKKDMDKDYSGKLMDIVTKSNSLGQPNSSTRIANTLKEDYGISRSRRSIRRDLHKLGFYWGKGVRRHLYHDSPQNVAYRFEYLKRRFENLVKEEGKWRPTVPEVFLDESYCHLDHATMNRWVMPGTAISEPGRLPILVIFAAFVVYFDQVKQEVVGKFVKDSVHIWPAIGKAHIKKSDGKATSKDTPLWNDVPPEIQEAGIIATDHDYHGNFNRTFLSVWEKCVNIGVDYLQAKANPPQTPEMIACHELDTDEISIDTIPEDHWIQILEEVESFNAQPKFFIDSFEIVDDQESWE
ncbi:hypothetical protein BGW38_001985 [Lunasporangiospora selenospora]|uniref:Uncharacterized protein n=1 Tax=Lunasporangiospora selenospora TaxID=979761 RepID=A0A9P6FTJ2_9FUNG|nr:hypothetical protein BGW38_001985 [Lunasporangiospora selenospora]